MKIQDIKIATQLKTGFGIILLLIIVLGGISWYNNDQMASRITDLYDHPLKVRRALGELKADIISIHRGMKDLCLAQNDKEIASILQEIDNYKATSFIQLNILKESYLGPPADIENTYNNFVKWNAIREETIRLLRSGKANEAKASTKPGGEGGLQAKVLLGHIQVIDNFAMSKGDQLYNSAVELNNTLNRQLFVLFTFILLITFLIIYLLTRNINRPLAELSSVTQLFKEGRHDARSSYVSCNEYGMLSTSFNELAETVETEMILNVQAAKLSGVMLSEDDAHRFCHALLRTLLEHTESQMGAVYLRNDEKTEFERFECIGIDIHAEGCKPFSAIHFEGEFGAALATKKIQHINSIPEDSRFTFFTVGGKFMPREIITIPIVAGNETLAVISLSTIKSFSKNSLRLLNTILSTLSARMDGILGYRKVIAFSQQLEHQNRELEEQKKELSAQAGELTEQNIELEMQKKQLDEANRLKTSFLSNMSHELRTPLNSVIALSGVLNRRLAGKMPEEEYSYLEVIERNGKQLLALINDILDLSRIESGRDDIAISKFNANGLIREVVELIDPQANQKNITLRYREEDNLPNIKSDYEKCRHILQNIVANAVKFTEEGYVEITTRAIAQTIHIEVNDTGIGIEEKFLPHIFDEFRQADASNSKKYGGTGLGLAIAKKYADLLGGSISVESTRGKGSRFTLSLPVNFTASQTNVEIMETGHRESAPKFVKNTGIANTKGKTILIVEDTESVIIQMKDMLETHGYNIMAARNGSEALEQIARKIPDGMILDLMMPGVDGFEVLKYIRQNEKTASLPVIILTAKYVSKEELSFLKHNSIHQLIQKGDINKDQLLDAVAMMVTPQAQEIEPPQKMTAPLSVSGTPVVLVVEDNPDNMLTIKALLAGLCSVIEANDGRQGIEMAKEKEHQPHLILMDIALPGINGIEALREIRKEKTLRDVPVIAVSASAMKGDRENFMALGFDGYISKPIDNKLFIKVIKEWIGK